MKRPDHMPEAYPGRAPGGELLVNEWKHPDLKFERYYLLLTSGKRPDGRRATMQPSTLSHFLFWNLPLMTGGSVAEIGTGGGGVLIAARRFLGAARCVGTDVSPSACNVARYNAWLNGAHLDIKPGAGLEPLQNERFSYIISNPASMPAELLDSDHDRVYRRGGPDGRDMISELARYAFENLASSGRLVMVVAGIASLRETLQEMHDSGLVDLDVLDAEIFCVDDRFTKDIETREQFIRRRNLFGEMFRVEHDGRTEWYETRYVVSGRRPLELEMNVERQNRVDDLAELARAHVCLPARVMTSRTSIDAIPLSGFRHLPRTVANQP